MVTPGAGMDARGLHGFASDVSQNLTFDPLMIGFTPYTNSLGLIYYLFIDSIFIGGLISCFFWLFSAILLLKTLRVFNVNDKNTLVIFFIYSFLPSSILFTSITLREVFQLFFINLSLYSYSQIYLNRRYFFYFPFFAGIILMSMLHGALLLFGAMLLFSAVLAVLLNQHTRDLLKKYLKVLVIVGILLLPVGFYALNIFSQISESYDIAEGIYFAVETYQNNLIREDARSNYVSEYKFNTASDFVIFIPFNFIQYFLEPFPWRISNIFDLLVFSENLLRLLLIIVIFKYVGQINNIYKPCIYGFLASLFFVELLWSIGTVNWGTAIRHHVPSLGILLLVTAVCLNERMTKKNYENISYY